VEDPHDRELKRRHGITSMVIAVVVLALGVFVYLALRESRESSVYADVALWGCTGVFVRFAVVGAIQLAGKDVPWWLVRSMYAQAYIERVRGRNGIAFTGVAPLPLEADEVVLATHRSRVRRGWIELLGGLAAGALGVWLVYSTYEAVSGRRDLYILGDALLVAGYTFFVIGIFRLLNAHAGLVKPHTGKGKRNEISIGVGFRTFVAWRYLMARHHRISRVGIGVFLVALFALLAGLLQWNTLLRDASVWSDPDRTLFTRVALAVIIAMVAGGVLIFFTVIVTLLRFVFSFFTTVPVVGVWIGVAALICVISVMSGFENDLRQKILGSNAHIQITAESGEIQNWRELMGRIDKVPGVLASTPYAVSEVVIAANNNGMNVIIKGIDPDSVGKVTKLVSSIKNDPALSMQRMQPLVEDARDLTVPQPTRPATGGDVVDPPPDDMPASGDPIDFSQPHDAPATDAGVQAGSDAFGGDARDVVAATPVVDPPPADLVTTDEEPTDYSGRSGIDDEDLDLPIDAVDIAVDQPSLSRRTQSLPGILVGAELVKQTHLYVGQEVRVVSPLSDPSNPDATGTPIPFNRDYRVPGVFFTRMYEYDLKYVYVTLDSLQDFLDRGEAIDGIEVRVGSPDETGAYVQRLQSMLDGAYGKQKYRVQDWKELNRSLFSALKLEKIAMFLVLGIVILVASFAIVGNLIMVVVEKAREIALLKTLGAADYTVMIVFAIQGLMIGLIGTGLGVATGLAACLVGKSKGIPLNPDVYYIDKMPVNIEPSSVVITAAAGVLISMLATFYPAVVAARVRPAAGMRH